MALLGLLVWIVLGCAFELAASADQDRRRAGGGTREAVKAGALGPLVSQAAWQALFCETSPCAWDLFGGNAGE